MAPRDPLQEYRRLKGKGPSSGPWIAGAVVGSILLFFTPTYIMPFFRLRGQSPQEVQYGWEEKYKKRKGEN
tara:strand:+ start:56 stop:268 length:213 start_codon:yes stop_codon:yes gene_type:complete